MSIENNHAFPETLTPEQREIIFQLINFSSYPVKELLQHWPTVQDAVADELNIDVSEVAKVVDELFKQMEEV